MQVLGGGQREGAGDNKLRGETLELPNRIGVQDHCGQL